jgi:hypothetical protein
MVILNIDMNINKIMNKVVDHYFSNEILINNVENKKNI